MAFFTHPTNPLPLTCQTLSFLSPAPVPSMSFPTKWQLMPLNRSFVYINASFAYHMISREVLKVKDCSFNLRASSLLHIGKDVLTSYVGKMVESLFFRSLQLSHTDIAYRMLLLLRSVAIRPTWDRGTKTELQKWIEKNFE